MSSTAAAMTYTSQEVQQMAKVSARELQYWDEQHVLPKAIVQSKHSRQFAPLQLAQVGIVKEMRRHGIALYKIHCLLRTKSLSTAIEASLPDDDGFYGKANMFYLLTNGNRLCKIAKSPDDVICVLRCAKEALHCIPLHWVVQRILPTTQTMVDAFSAESERLLQESA
jgi:DNA-binding transcriptional MerR regulator